MIVLIFLFAVCSMSHRRTFCTPLHWADEASQFPLKGNNMHKVPLTPPVKPKDLAQEKSDFTAEGAPVPGNVATAPPLTPEDVEKVTLAMPDPESKKEKVLEKNAEKEAEKKKDHPVSKG
jgi:hypothetical protein